MYSPRIIRDMITVKMGAELFTVSAKETATFFRLTRPKTTVANLNMSQKCVRGGRSICSPHQTLRGASLGGPHTVLGLALQETAIPPARAAEAPVWPERQPRGSTALTPRFDLWLFQKEPDQTSVALRSTKPGTLMAPEWKLFIETSPALT